MAAKRQKIEKYNVAKRQGSTAEREIIQPKAKIGKIALEVGNFLSWAIDREIFYLGQSIGKFLGNAKLEIMIESQ